MNTRALRMVVLLLAVSAGLVYWYLPLDDEPGELKLYGNVDIREVQLGFRVGGKLAAMYREEGDPVLAGDELARLDRRPFEDGLALAGARVAEAEARLLKLRTGSRAQEIEQAQARVKEAQAALDNARQEYVRQEELTGKGLSSQRLLDRALAQRDQAAARLDANREALELAVEGARTEDISAAEAALAAARAQLAQAQTQFDDTVLVAPANGTIFTRAREPGAIVAVGAPVYTLSLTDTVYVRAYVDEPFLGRVVPGARVMVRTDSSARTYEGQVGFISPRAEFTPRSVETEELRTDLVYRLRIVISEPDDALRQGMPVTVRIPAGA